MKNKLKRILAVAGIILLAAMYLVTLFLAIFQTEETQNLFYGFVLLDIAVPILIWVFSFMIQHFSGRK